MKKRVSFLWEKYRSEIIPKLKEIKEKFKITPSQVNVTYKGLHILFHYNRDSYFITPEIHQNINNTLNEILGWDENARDLARVYKMLGYIDWKNWKKGKIRSLQLSNPGTNYIAKEINREVIENNFWLEFKLRNENELLNLHNKLLEKLEKQMIKIWRIKTNISKINEVDGFEIITKLQEYFWKFPLNKSKKIDKDVLEKINNKIKFKDIWNGFLKFYDEDWIKLTSGLFLVKNNFWYEIRDYSQKTRQSNYNFIKNWVLRWIESDYNLFNEIIYYASWITLNVGGDKKSIIDKKVFVDFLNSRLILPNTNIKVLKDNEEPEKTILKSYNYPDWFAKIFIGLMHYIYKNIEEFEFNNNDKTYIIEVNKFLSEVFDIKTKSSLEHNKKTLFDIIEIISNTKLDMITKNVRIFSDIKRSKKSNKDILIISPSDNNFKFQFWTPMYFNKNILNFQKGFKDLKITELLLFINGFLEITKNNLTYKLKDIYEFLWYFTNNEKSKKSMLLKSLKKSKKLWIIKTYKISKDSIIFSKYKVIK